MKRRACFLFFLLWIFAGLIGIQGGFAQSHQARLDQGIKLYRAGQWNSAAVELRRSQREAVGSGQLSASLYWLSLTEFALGEYDAALRDINELQWVAPAGMRMDDIIFYKGRALYYLERPAEALPLFRAYGDVLARQNTPNTQAEKTVLAYWIGECLYALGQQEQAAVQFTLVVNTRPRSEKYEAAAYRLALIEQENIAKELLDTMNMNYTEYQEALEEYQQLLTEAERQIRTLESSRDDRATMSGAGTSSSAPLPAVTIDPIQRIRDLKATAEKRRNELSLME
jgi:tetratricopeptide (TPR) repeat protein